MKKTLAFLLAGLMLFAMVSCSGDKKPSPSGDPTDLLGPNKDDEEINLYEYDFKFMALTDYETFFFPTPGASAYGDKILDRYKQTSQKFNCNVDVAAVASTDDIINGITRSVAVGDTYADLVDVTARVLHDNMTSFENLDDIDGIDMTSKKWGPAQYLETSTFKGNHYGFIAYYWGMPYPQYIGNLFFMKAVVCDEFGLVNPQELYENKNWYWDNFHQYAADLTVVDNADKNNTRYGFVVSGEMKMPRAFIISNGVQLIDYNETTGKYESHIEDPRVAEAISYLKGMVDEGIGFYTSDAWEVAARMFKEKRTAFYEAYNKHAFVTAELHLASDLGEEYSWLPYPCGPKGTYGESTAQFWYSCRFLGMPLASDEGNKECAVIIINDLFEPLEDETETSWWDVVKSNYFFDDLSYKYYIDLFEGGHTDYSASAYDAVFTHHVAIYNTVLSGKSSVAEAITKYAEKVQDNIDENLNAD